MIVVHHLNNSRSQRVLWLLEELGVPYDIKRYQREPSGLAPASLRQVHPLGKSPVVVDDGLVLAESGAIAEYLADRYGHGKLAPAVGTAERLRFNYWLHYAEGSAMPPLLLKLVFDRLDSPSVPWLVRPVSRAIANKVKSAFIQPQIDLHLNYMEGELAKAPWFVGSELTAADTQLSFPLEAAVGRGGLNASRPKLMDFIARIHARPAYQRALERGGPYSMG